MSNTKQILNKRDISEAGFRWMLMPVCIFNYETQLAPAVVFTLSKSLRKIYPNDEDYIKALNNHYKYYNSQPYLSALILGAALAVEEQEGIEGMEAVQNIKTGLMGPLAGIGDTLFWVLLPTIFGSIAAYSALEGSYTGVIIMLAYAIGVFLIRMRFFSMGYNTGRKVITQFGAELNIFTEAASVLGLTVVGALIPSVISVTTPIVFTSGDVTSELQATLNSIMPSMIPVLCTLLAYFLLNKKKVKMTTVILWTLVLSMITYALGILA
ncbi:PTS system mannose-specific EIID component [bioreactor metagenome]|uniref:PTS system mannose-specific EIID component n=1 Tax=bioreactor metagenome TaxID=1076179 RepID=A0A645BXV3_9ZZZZ|nr:PTS system mannose/fructose/sorbose family transporter subunit IID [Erysipelotrichaceae bacterium]